jgi:hypothetical protein
MMKKHVKDVQALDKSKNIGTQFLGTHFLSLIEIRIHKLLLRDVALAHHI